MQELTAVKKPSHRVGDFTLPYSALTNWQLDNYPKLKELCEMLIARSKDLTIREAERKEAELLLKDIRLLVDRVSRQSRVA